MPRPCSGGALRGRSVCPLIGRRAPGGPAAGECVSALGWSLLSDRPVARWPLSSCEAGGAGPAQVYRGGRPPGRTIGVRFGSFGGPGLPDALAHSPGPRRFPWAGSSPPLPTARPCRAGEGAGGSGPAPLRDIEKRVNQIQNVGCKETWGKKPGFGVIPQQTFYKRRVSPGWGIM